MNDGLNQPHHPPSRKPRRRKRGFSGGPAQDGQNQVGQNQGQGGQNRNNNNRNNRNQRNNRGQRRGPAFVGPMDHSYRNQNGTGQPGRRFSNGVPNEGLEPLPPPRIDAPARIFAFLDDLFFLAKIQEVSRKLNVKVEFVKSEKEMAERAGGLPEDKPSLIIVDLNSNSMKPLQVISKLRSKFKKGTSIVGFVSHVQGDLKVKASEAGCDVVMPRSAFSQTLPNMLRRHGAEEEKTEDTFNKV
jgi:CheY-like chemotaxis protein